jgi:probable F420-dependent oxidoreductase
MRFGLRIPSFAWPDLTYQDADALRAYCRQIDALPFEDIWVIEHLLVAPAVYGVSWLDPLTVLTLAAAVTERVGLGTSALVLPLRHPVMLAKEVATLQYLSKGRFILGVAAGWDENEFKAMGVPLKERGRRADEVLDLAWRLLTEDEVDFDGRYFLVNGVSIYPRTSTPPKLWVAGGSLGHAPETPDKPYMAKSVLRRILRADGWMCRSSGSDLQMVIDDWSAVQAFLRENGRDPSTITFGHTQFVHISESSSHEEALNEQAPHFVRVMGTHRTAEDLAASYLMGTVEEIQDRISALAKVGLEYLILTPVSNDAEQLNALVKHVVEPFS